MYQNLLKQNDKIKKLSSLQKLELNDYINMSSKGLPIKINWNNMKHNTVTDFGDTVWQLSEALLNSEIRVIDQIYPPISLIKWIINTSENN